MTSGIAFSFGVNAALSPTANNWSSPTHCGVNRVNSNNRLQCKEHLGTGVGARTRRCTMPTTNWRLCTSANILEEYDSGAIFNHALNGSKTIDDNIVQSVSTVSDEGFNGNAQATRSRSRSDMEHLQRLEEDYRKSKAAYKEAKERRKRATCKLDNLGSGEKRATTVSLTMIATLEQEYQQKKDVYKRAKASIKEAEKMTKTDTKSESCVTSPMNDNLWNGQWKQSGGEKANIEPSTVTICGGKTCRRLGAEAVASVIRGEGTVVDKCMKKCGGIGPSIRLVNGKVVKVNLRGAVRQAIEKGSVDESGTEFRV